MKRKCRHDQKAWLGNRASEAENAALGNDTKTLYQQVGELIETVSNTSIPVKDKTGTTLLTENQQNARWVEHFTEFLNQPELTIKLTLQLDNTHPVSELEVNTGTITEEEVRKQS